MANDFIRIPPDSTGKQLRNVARLDVLVSSVDSALLASIVKGDTITGNTSGATARFFGFSDDGVNFYIYLGTGGGDFTVGETLLFSATPLAVVDSYNQLFTQTVSVTDADDPSNTQRIDNAGAAYTRAPEGYQLFDAFGNAQVSQLTSIDNYQWIYTDIPHRFYIESAVGGSSIHNAESSLLRLVVTDASGSLYRRTTNTYYPYLPGTGTQTMFSIASGDVGKAGVVRRWGIYNDTDGIYFELNGTDFSVNERSSVTGAVVNQKINRNSFNGDKLLSPNTSPFQIDFSKFNLYWIDFQWLGVGKVRFGAYSPFGERIVLHTFTNANKNTIPYMKTGTLPIRMEIFNETGTASSSELRVACIAVTKQNDEDFFIGKEYTYVSETVTVNSLGNTPVLSFQPRELVNGIVNRTVSIPIDFEFTVDGQPIRVDVIANSALTGSSFINSASAASTILLDTGSTDMSGGQRIETIFQPAGVSLRELTNRLDNALQLQGDGTPNTFTLAARSSISGSSNVTILSRWKELR